MHNPRGDRILAAMSLSSLDRLERGQKIDLPCVDLRKATIVLFPGEAFVEYPAHQGRFAAGAAHRPAVSPKNIMATSNMADPAQVEAEFQYQAHDGWAKLPPDWHLTEVAAVATDSQDRLFAFHRGEKPVMVFDREGTLLASWGENLFVRPHGITLGPDDAVYCTDDLGHTVRKFTPDGRLLMTLGIGRPSDTGATSIDFRTIRRSGPPFHYPTNVALSPQGDIYVSDGYGNARVHKFAPDGRLLLSWGEPGAGPGQFRVPHGIAVDREGTVWVADRENSRIQIFSADGTFVDQWNEIARPCQVAFDGGGNLWVAELGYRAGIWPGTAAPAADATGGRVSVFCPRGRLLARFGGGDNPTAPGDFFAPHGICIDSRGDVYVAEVARSAGGDRGLVSPDCHTLQKLERCRSKKEGHIGVNTP